jgi:hypothetical protein
MSKKQRQKISISGEKKFLCLKTGKSYTISDLIVLFSSYQRTQVRPQPHNQKLGIHVHLEEEMGPE